MTVYVDDMRQQATVGRLKARWSHMFADTTVELDAFAVRLGLRVEWRQKTGTRREHYDLTGSRRDEALRLGATPITYPYGTAELLALRRELEDIL